MRPLFFLAIPLLMGAAPGPSSESAYQEARKSYYLLKKDPARRKLRHNWLSVTSRFEEVAARFPKSARAPDALFTAARTLEELSRISRLDEDLNKSLEDYQKLLANHPRHHLADDAAVQLAHVYLDRMGKPEEARKVVNRALEGRPQRADQRKELQSLLASLPREVKRPVVKAVVASKGKADPEPPAERSGERERSSEKLAEKNAERPERSGSEKSGAEEGKRPGLVTAVEKWARAQGPSPKADSHAKLEAEEAEAKAEAEPRPHRSALAAAEKSEKSERSAERAERAEAEEGRPLEKVDAKEAKEAKARLRQVGKLDSEITLAEQLGLKVRRVVIDPGHGGHDSGALGKDGTKEKNVALAISKKVAKELTTRGFEVFLTRDDDTFVRLEDRAHLANEAKGDLFVSIHCNSAHNRKLRGVETYTLNTSADRYSIRLAARENASSAKSMSDLQFILADLATKANTDESNRLAERVQKGVVGKLSRKYEGVKDLGQKQALFYVLLGAKMPAILVETSFLSHPEEEKRLSSSEYQEDVAAAIASGISDFVGQRDRLARVD